MTKTPFKLDYNSLADKGIYLKCYIRIRINLFFFERIRLKKIFVLLE